MVVTYVETYKTALYGKEDKMAKHKHKRKSTKIIKAARQYMLVPVKEADCESSYLQINIHIFELLRRVAGVTQKQLAEKLGVNVAVVGRWETEHAVTTEALVRVEEVLELKLEDMK